METVHIDFFGISCDVHCPKRCAKWLKKDFHEYVAAESRKPPRRRGDCMSAQTIQFSLFPKMPDYKMLPEIVAKTYHEHYIVYESENVRIIDFFKQALIMYHIDPLQIEVFSRDQDFLYEVFIMAFETILGELADKGGMHRIHCLALEHKGKAALLLLPPGAGKTTMALEFLDHPEIRILAEDQVMMRDNTLYGIHTSWGIADKQMNKVPDAPDGGRVMRSRNYHDKFRFLPPDRQCAAAAEPWIILHGKRYLSDQSYIRRIPRRRICMPIFKSMVLGLELQQSLAFFLLRNYKDAFSKASIGISRLRSMLNLMMQCRTYEFLIGADVAKNVDMLERFIIDSTRRNQPDQ
ncbi:MAG: hypothetical protein ACOCWQ_03780 [Nanoarchaeota archaeon]